MTIHSRVPPVRPHIHEHLTETERTFVDEMVQPISVQEAADRTCVTIEYARGRLTQSTKDALHIEAKWHWRVALTRLYYGIDRCWCQR